MNELKLKDDRNIKRNRPPLSPALRFKILKKYGYTCQYCGRTSEDGTELEIDHIIPYSKGGTNDEGNLQVACRECNRGKMAEEILSEQSDAKVVEKIVYKEVPVEKVIYKGVPDYLASLIPKESYRVNEKYDKMDIKEFLKTNYTFSDVGEFVETKARQRLKLQTDAHNLLPMLEVAPTK